MSCYKDIKDNYKNDIKNHEEYSKLATYQEEMEWLPIEFEFGKSNNDPNWYKVKPKLFV